MSENNAAPDLENLLALSLRSVLPLAEAQAAVVAKASMGTAGEAPTKIVTDELNRLIGRANTALDRYSAENPAFADQETDALDGEFEISFESEGSESEN